MIFTNFWYLCKVSTSEPDATAKESAMDVDKPNSTAPDSSEDNCHQPEQSENAKNIPAAGNGSDVCNGEVSDSKQADGEDNNISSSNGSTTPVKSGKAKGKNIFFFSLSYNHKIRLFSIYTKVNTVKFLT